MDLKRLSHDTLIHIITDLEKQNDKLKEENDKYIEINEEYIEKYPPNLSSAGIIADPGLNMFENNNWAKRGQD